MSGGFWKRGQNGICALGGGGLGFPLNPVLLYVFWIFPRNVNID